MEFTEYYVHVLKNYAVFDGRARRAEYWYFVLVNMIVGFLIGAFVGILSAIAGTDLTMLSGLYSLAIFIPSLAVGVRRLHDTGRSGLWYFLILVPFGVLVILYFFIQEGEAGQNQYGPNPKTMAATTAPSAYAAQPAYGAQPTYGTPAATVPVATVPVAAQPAVAAGWMPDPTGRHEFRYWDAAAWTEHVSDQGVASVDPV